jgi:hypothetical protein
MANKPDLKLIANIPVVVRFPFAQNGGCDPSWSGPSKQDPSKMRYAYTVEVGADQPQYTAGEHSMFTSESMKGLIDNAGLSSDTWIQLAHLDVSGKHTLEAHVWNSEADGGKGAWDRVPDPGPAAPAGAEGASSGPAAGQRAAAPSQASPTETMADLVELMGQCLELADALWTDHFEDRALDGDTAGAIERMGMTLFIDCRRSGIKAVAPTLPTPNDNPPGAKEDDDLPF